MQIMSKFIKIQNYTIAKSDVKRLAIREFNQPPIVCQIVVYLYSVQHPSKNIFINYESKEEAQQDREKAEGTGIF